MKRLFSFLLVASLMLSLATTAFAADGGTDNSPPRTFCEETDGCTPTSGDEGDSAVPVAETGDQTEESTGNADETTDCVKAVQAMIDAPDSMTDPEKIMAQPNAIETAGQNLTDEQRDKLDFFSCRSATLRVTAGRQVLASESFTMPKVGFNVRMNPRYGVQPDRYYFDEQTLYMDLEEVVSAYIEPYIEGVTVPVQTPWGQHTYYTFEFNDIVLGTQQKKKPFGTETIYNRANTGDDSETSKIVVQVSADERLYTSYYTITVKAYQSGYLGTETPASDTLLGTAAAKLYVCMTKLNWLDSYLWNNEDLDSIYRTPEELIENHLKNKKTTDGCNSEKSKTLANIPIAWVLSDGTAHCAEPGAENSFTWTAHPETTADYKSWIIPRNFVLSKNLTFRNPFAVIFRDGETIIGTLHAKNGCVIGEDQFPQLPSREGYAGRWNREPGLTVSDNTEIMAVYVPIEYSVSYELNNGVNASDNPNSYTIEDTFTLSKPYRDGDCFMGWTCSGQDIPQKEVTISAGTTTGELMFTANWNQHSFRDWEIVGSPDCTNGGSEKRVCSVCGETETRNVEAAGHDWEEGFAVDVEATCTTDGSKSIHCKNCDATKNNAAIPAVGYSYGDWQYNEDSHWKECSVCKNKTTETKHDFKWALDREATFSAVGSKHEECTVCGYKKAAVEIPAAGGTNTGPGTADNPPSDVPQTGDTSNIVLWFMLMIASLGGVCASFLYGKKAVK